MRSSGGFSLDLVQGDLGLYACFALLNRRDLQWEKRAGHRGRLPTPAGLIASIKVNCRNHCFALIVVAVVYKDLQRPCEFCVAVHVVFDSVGVSRCLLPAP